MKRRRNFIIPIIVAILVVFGTYLRQRTMVTDLIVGTNPTFPPFEYIGGERGNEMVGFDIELAKIIAENKGKKLKLIVLEFENLIPALQNGDIDMAISTMTITEERKQIVDFSDSYYADRLVVLIRKDDDTFANIDTKEALGENKRLASRVGTTGLITANTIAAGKHVVAQNSWQSIVNKLLENRIDAVIMDSGPAKAFINKYDNIAILPIEFETEYYGIAVKKGNNNLLEAINKSLDSIKTSGVYDNLVDQYIDGYMLEE